MTPSQTTRIAERLQQQADLFEGPATSGLFSAKAHVALLREAAGLLAAQHDHEQCIAQMAAEFHTALDHVLTRAEAAEGALRTLATAHAKTCLWWRVPDDEGCDCGRGTNATILRAFLSRSAGPPASVAASDPHAADPGKPSTRDP